MRKRRIDIDEIIDSIDIDEFANFYKNTRRKEAIEICHERYGWSALTFGKIINKLQLNKKDNSKIKETKKKQSNNLLNSLSTKISKEQLFQYWQNHTNQETAKYFDITLYSLQLLLEYYSIQNTNERKNSLREKTNIIKYGETNPSKSDVIKKKKQQTCLEKYGAVSNLCTAETKEKSKYTRVQKYGVEYIGQAEEIKQKIRDIKQQRYGNPTYANPDKGKQTRIKHYGSLERSYQEGLKNRSVRYDNTKPNQIFAEFLEENNISYEREFICGRFRYDFKINHILVEINPSITHNSTKNPFNRPKDKEYHRRKTENAIQNNFICIHIFDWNNQAEIISNISKYLANEIKLKVANISEPQLHLYNIKTKEHIIDNNSLDLDKILERGFVEIYDDGYQINFVTKL